MRASRRLLSLCRTTSFCLRPLGVRALATAVSALLNPNENGPSAPAVVRVRLRQYQEECIQAVLSYIDNGHKRLGISLATGSGKTVIFTQLIDRVRAPRPTATQTLILVHRRELVEQAATHCSNAYPGRSIEIEMGNTHASGLADITIASVRSIISGDRMQKFNPRSFKLILVDEAHHIVARGYMDTLQYFGLMEPTEQSPALVGVSATLSRFDGLRLGAAIDHIVYHKDYVDMIGEKWLSDVIFTTVKSNADISRVRKGANGDFQPGELSKAINTNETNEITVRAWLARAGNRRSTIVFCVDLTHVSSLTEMFRKHGIDARFVTGDTPKKIRSERLDAFRAGKFPVMLNCGVFTEGTDIPNIDCVLLARPTRSRNLLVQMIGRGMRLNPEKENCHIIDMVASLETGIVTTPTLFGLDPSELVKEADVEQLKELRDRKELEARREECTADIFEESPSLSRRMSRNVTFTDYDSVYDLIDDTSGERHIRSISLLAWVQVEQDRYIFSIQGGDYLTIEKAPAPAQLYSIFHTAKIPPAPEAFSSEARKSKSPYMRPRQVATAETFADAVHAADTYASESFSWRFLGKDQAWRKAPATEGQLALLNKFRNMKDQLTPDMISKGKAGDMITKIKHGAKGRFDKLEASKRRQGRVIEKLGQQAELRERELVRVGPLLG